MDTQRQKDQLEPIYNSSVLAAHDNDGKPNIDSFKCILFIGLLESSWSNQEENDCLFSF